MRMLWTLWAWRAWTVVGAYSTRIWIGDGVNSTSMWMVDGAYSMTVRTVGGAYSMTVRTVDGVNALMHWMVCAYCMCDVMNGGEGEGRVGI